MVNVVVLDVDAAIASPGTPDAAGDRFRNGHGPFSYRDL